MLGGGTASIVGLFGGLQNSSECVLGFSLPRGFAREGENALSQNVELRGGSCHPLFVASGSNNFSTGFSLLELLLCSMLRKVLKRGRRANEREHRTIFRHKKIESNLLPLSQLSWFETKNCSKSEVFRE